MSRTRVNTPPNAAPGFRPNEIVTAGSCPLWLTVCGPTTWFVCASVSRGTTVPDEFATLCAVTMPVPAVAPPPVPLAAAAADGLPIGGGAFEYRSRGADG